MQKDQHASSTEPMMMDEDGMLDQSWGAIGVAFTQVQLSLVSIGAAPMMTPPRPREDQCEQMVGLRESGKWWDFCQKYEKKSVLCEGDTRILASRTF
jgi:hypothetical protein